SVGDMLLIFGRETPDAEWTLWTKIRRVHYQNDSWEFACDAPDARKIYVRIATPESDVSEIRAFDLATHLLGERVGGVPGHDVQGAVTIDDMYVGVRYTADRRMYALNDSKLQTHLDGVNQYFKNGASVELIGVDRTHTRMLLYVDGPQDPGDYYLYDAKRA